MPEPKTNARRRKRTSARASVVDASEFPLDDSTAYLLRELLRVNLKLLREGLAKLGLALGYFLYLRALWEKDGVTQRELGRRIGVNDASSRVALEGLEKQGLVRRRRSATDMRKIRIFLTAKGKQLQKDVLPIAKDIDDRMQLGFSASERQMFRSFLLQARENLESRPPRGAGS
jgi:DNA-binding MarR family transcriptional regulator